MHNYLKKYINIYSLGIMRNNGKLKTIVKLLNFVYDDT